MDNLPFFNASLERLKQLMHELDILRGYSANNNVIGMFNNLREIKKISKGFLTKDQIGVLKTKWEIIKNFEIIVNDYSITHDPKLLDSLHNLDEWLQYTLHKAGVLYKAQDTKTGLEGIRKRYNLQNASD